METSPPDLPSPPLPRRRRIHLLLLGATFVTATLAGSWSWEGTWDGLGWPPLTGDALARGLPYATLLILILGAHELGHYFACRWYGVPATRPFFIPGIPLLIGTFGAVIRIRGAIPSRKALFDIAAAGPVAGFVVALPVLAWGVATAVHLPTEVEPHGLFIGSPLVSWLLERSLHGDADLRVGSIYGAAWVGMLVTSMNLFPVGQLDGGHAVFAVSPRHHRAVSWLTILAVGALVVWQGVTTRSVPGYALWLGILLVLRDRHPRLGDETTPLDRPRLAVALVLLVMLVLTFIPMPLRLV